MKKVLLTLMLTSIAHANELRIYSGFAEVIQPVQVKNHQFSWAVGEADLCQIVPSSLAVQGATVTQYTSKLQQTSWLESLTGKGVKVRLSEGTLDGTVQKVEGETLFVQEQGTDLVYPVQATQLVFQGLPPITRDQTGLVFQFTLKNEKGPLLRYFTRSIEWSPNYTLDVNGKSGKLTGWADIQNRTAEALKVNRADLFSGNFQLPSEQFESCEGGVPRPLAPNAGKTGMLLTSSPIENRISTPVLTSGASTASRSPVLLKFPPRGTSTSH